MSHIQPKKQQSLELTAGESGIPVIDLKAGYADTCRVRRDENGHYIIPHKWRMSWI